jgi:hypothetical protein
MVLVDGIIVGVVSGAVMGVASEALYRLGVFKASQFLVDGSFITDRLKGQAGDAKKYAFGIPIHLLTGTVFGAVYMVGTDALDWEADSPGLIAVYVLILWLSMLFAALPVAGQGFLGKKVGQYAWLEQFFAHAVYGVVLWALVQVI